MVLATATPFIDPVYTVPEAVEPQNRNPGTWLRVTQFPAGSKFKVTWRLRRAGRVSKKLCSQPCLTGMGGSVACGSALLQLAEHVRCSHELTTHLEPVIVGAQLKRFQERIPQAKSKIRPALSYVAHQRLWLRRFLAQTNN